MHHAVHTVEQLIDRLGVLQGHGHDLLASFGSPKLRNIADPEGLAVGFEAWAQNASQPACGPSEQQTGVQNGWSGGHMGE